MRKRVGDELERDDEIELPHNYTVEEMRQLRAVHVKVQSIPYYMDIIINNRVVCVIGFFFGEEVGL